MKVCTRCHKPKSESAFAKNATARDGLFIWCRVCSADHGREYRKNAEVRAERKAAYEKWAKANPERRRVWKRSWNIKNPHKARQYQLKIKYGITPVQFLDLLKKQNGRCAICQTTRNLKSFVVDHDHKTKKVRGILCPSCNKGLGFFKDRSLVMLRAVKYVRQ